MAKRTFTIVITTALLCCFLLPLTAQAARKKVAFILLGTIDDRGWNSAHFNGIQYMQDRLGDKIEVSYTENVAPKDAERVLRNYAHQGYNIIFANSFPHMDAMLLVANEYPDIRFEHCSGYKTTKNMGNYFVRVYQAEYLSGYTAGLMGYKNVGTVATLPIPETIRGINAFTIGLKKGLDKAGYTYNATKLNTVVWMNTWAHPHKETTLAKMLADNGHDLIRQMADTPESSLAACSKMIPAIGYGTDAASYGADCVLTSSMMNWGPYYVKTVQSLLNGKWKAKSFWGGFEADGVRLAPFGTKVPAKVRAKVNAEMSKLWKGKDNIFIGPIANQSGDIVIPSGQQATDNDLLSMMYFVKGVAGSLPN